MHMRRTILTFAAIIAAPLSAGIAIAQTDHSQHGGTHTPAPAGPPFVIPFTRGGTSVNSDMEPILDRVVAYAQTNRSMGVVITGIANSGGSRNSQATRARAMAQAIREELRSRGIPESRTSTAAEGDAQVGAINRVEVTFVAR
jgi:outer membrane protein OmpA-like peptidoglycan-associated protein